MNLLIWALGVPEFPNHQSLLRNSHASALRLSDSIWAFLGLNEMNRFEWSQLGNIWNISIQVHWRNWLAAGSQVLKRGDQATYSKHVPMKGVQELYSKTHVQQTNKLLDKCFKKELFKNRAASMQWKIVFSEHRTKICCKNGVYIIKCRPEKSPRHVQYMCATIKKLWGIQLQASTLTALITDAKVLACHRNFPANRKRLMLIK